MGEPLDVPMGEPLDADESLEMGKPSDMEVDGIGANEGAVVPAVAVARAPPEIVDLVD